jgi:hypothetical protein
LPSSAIERRPEQRVAADRPARAAGEDRRGEQVGELAAPGPALAVGLAELAQVDLFLRPEIVLERVALDPAHPDPVSREMREASRMCRTQVRGREARDPGVGAGRLDVALARAESPSWRHCVATMTVQPLLAVGVLRRCPGGVRRSRDDLPWLRGQLLEQLDHFLDLIVGEPVRVGRRRTGRPEGSMVDSMFLREFRAEAVAPGAGSAFPSCA